MGRSRLGVWAAACAAAGSLCLAGGAPAADQRATADWFTLETPPLAAGQIELLTLSTLPRAVSGGEVLVAVRGLRPSDRLVVKLNGSRVRQDDGSPRQAEIEDAHKERRALVTGLRRGLNRITATARGPGPDPSATLTVENHPLTGPIGSGPHQKPFYCETEESGLGPSRKNVCHAPTRYQWYYRSALDLAFHELDDPFAAYPADTATATTSDGRVVPFVVRVESSTINRGVARIAVLDDPAARGPDGTFEPNWNGRLTHSFGESCGSGYHQGSNQADRALGGVTGAISADSIFQNIYGLSSRLAAGDAVSLSTMTTFGVYCNPAVSPETLAMIKEHISERYGPVDRTLGVGGSGGALQTYNAASNFPGLIDGGVVVGSFTDIPSTGMSVIDCGLLVHYWETTDLEWSDAERTAVAGHLNPSICRSWVSTFLPLLDPHDGCAAEVPERVRYNRQTNPDGVRCSLPDALVNLVGRDPKTGFARLPIENLGVQYGLAALERGEISAQQFIELNRRIGGYDADSRHTPRRMRISRGLAKRMYALGAIIGRGPLEQTPIIDLATYLDPIPIANIHDVVRPFMIRARLREQKGSAVSQSIWRGVSTPADAFAAMDEWLNRLDESNARRTRAVATAKPASAEDRCMIGTLGATIEIADGLVLPTGITVQLLPALLGASPLFSLPLGAFISETQEVGAGVCDVAFPAKLEPRIVSGEPLSDDVLKCRRKQVRGADYDVPLTGEELAALRRIFPHGVCDYSRPGYGEQVQAKPWPSIGGRELEALHHLRWTTARSG